MYNVMIVDDEIISQDILANYIRTRYSNYTVTSICSNGQEALDSFLETPADIVLVDIRMPVMDGLTLIEKLNKLSNAVRVTDMSLREKCHPTGWHFLWQSVSLNKYGSSRHQVQQS